MLDIGNTAAIRVAPASVNGWTAWLKGTAPLMDIEPGAAVALIAPIDGSYVVSGGNKALNFLNLDGAGTADYTITPLGPKS